MTKIECVDLGRGQYRVRVWDGRQFIAEHLPMASTSTSAIMIALGWIRSAGVILHATPEQAASLADLDMADRRGVRA